MSRKSALALTAIAVLGLATFAPDAGSASGLGGGFNGRISGSFSRGGFQTGVRVGNNVVLNAGRGTVPLGTKNNLNRFAGALVTEVTLPKLDGSSKDAAYFGIASAAPHQYIAVQNRGCRACAAAGPH